MQELALSVAPTDGFQDCVPYRMVHTFYGNRCTDRSRVPLINHINEGYIILQRIGASRYAAEAFCLHPLLQADDDLKANYLSVCQQGVDKQVIILVMEYRNIANAFLSDKVVASTSPTRPALSPLPDVNNMLVADKVQNRKDFLRYHGDAHGRAHELDQYFNLWLETLGITEGYYQELIAGL